MLRAFIVLTVLSSLVAGCGEDEAPGDPPAASTRNHLLWKRAHAVEQDLARALELPVDEVCNELGELSCVNRVHLTSLGGHDPFRQGLYRPLANPLVTTPLVFDRVALAACGHRVALDREGPPVVFTALDLDGNAPGAGSDSFTETATTLYRRFARRDPLSAELEILGELVDDDSGARVAGHEFAHLACFAVATTTEQLFF